MKIRFIWAVFLLFTLIENGCKKFIDVPPPQTQIVEGNVYNNDATAAAVLTGMYIQMSSNSMSSLGGVTSISFASGLSADEFTLYSGLANPQLTSYYTNALSTAMGDGGTEFWINLYAMVFSCNSALEGLNASTGLTPAVKQQLLGETKFLRAFFYFYLVNLYGDVPLVLSSDYTINAGLARSPQNLVYQQLINDLKDAENLLTAGYVNSDALTVYPAGAAQRVRPNRYAAMALLARVYLLTGDWVDAESQADSVISNVSYYSLSALNNAFLMNSTEAIWQLQPVGNGTNSNTQEGVLFVLPPTGPSNLYPVYLNQDILNSFEPGDQRAVLGNWINAVLVGTDSFYFPYKYKIGSVNTGTAEYSMVLRLGEQYLIRAEARVQQGNITGNNSGVTDLNAIRERAGLSDYAEATDQQSVLSAILHERRVELFSEWGHRWLDLKRTANVDQVMTVTTPLKGGIWLSYQQLYPIFPGDIQKDPQLAQNPGY